MLINVSIGNAIFLKDINKDVRFTSIYIITVNDILIIIFPLDVLQYFVPIRDAPCGFTVGQEHNHRGHDIICITVVRQLLKSLQESTVDVRSWWEWAKVIILINHYYLFHVSVVAKRSVVETPRTLSPQTNHANGACEVMLFIYYYI